MRTFLVCKFIAHPASVFMSLLLATGCRPATNYQTVSTNVDKIVLGGPEGKFALDLGKIVMGGAMKRQVRILTDSGRPIYVDGYSSSCPCVTVTGFPLAVSKNSPGELTFTLDFVKEAEFVGNLGVIIELRSEQKAIAKGEILFVVTE